MIFEDYVSFEVAKLLKEKGFDWGCISYYVDDEPNDVKYSFLGETNSTWESRCCSAPTHQMAMAWIRDKYKIFIEIVFDIDIKESCFYYKIIDMSNNDLMLASYILCNSYEEAVDSALKYTLENIIL